MHLKSLLIGLLLTPITAATNLLIALPANSVSAPSYNPSTLSSTTTATLTTLSSTHTTPLRTDNTFLFHNISSGSYLLDVHCTTYAFAPLRVDIGSGAGEDVEVWGTFRGNEWENKGEKVDVKNVGGTKIFEVRGLTEKGYYVERSGFSPLSILKNPMILIAGVSMILVFGMPYLMDNMDPELREELEARQKTSPLTGGPIHQNPMANFDAAAWLAGSGKKGGDSGEKGVTK